MMNFKYALTGRAGMRTTLTIDDRASKRLKQISYEAGKSYKQVVNETLRAGLQASEVRESARPYRLKPVSMGEVAPGFDLDKALELSDKLEDAEIVRKLALRK
jgi:hypothetical protein